MSDAPSRPDEATRDSSAPTLYPTRHALDSFLERWFAQEGEGDSPLLRVRVAQALSLSGPWTRDRLKHTLSALLTWDGPSSQRLEALFEQTFVVPEASRAVRELLEAPEWDADRLLARLEAGDLQRSGREVPFPADPSASSGDETRPPFLPSHARVSTQEPTLTAPAGEPARPRTRMHVAVGLLALLVLGISLWVATLWLGPEPPTPTPAPVTPVSPTPNPEPTPEPQTVRRNLPNIVPVEAVPSGSSAGVWWTVAASSLGLLLLLLLWLRWSRYVPPLGGGRSSDVAPQSREEEVEPLRFQDPPLPSPWPGALLDRLAYQVGDEEDDARPRLDIEATIAATLRSGGPLDPRYVLARQVGELRWMVCADLESDPVAAWHLSALKKGLEARCIRLQPVAPETAPVEGVATLVFVHGGQGAYWQGDNWLARIPWGLPHAAFVELRDPSLWGAETAHYPQQVFSLDEADLLRALDTALRDQGLRQGRPLTGETRQSDPARDRLVGIERLAGACVLAGSVAPTSLEGLEALRRRTFPASRALDLQRVASVPGVTAWGGGPGAAGAEGAVAAPWRITSAAVARLTPALPSARALDVLAWQEQRVREAEAGNERGQRQKELLLELLRVWQALLQGVPERKLRRLLAECRRLEREAGDPGHRRDLLSLTRLLRPVLEPRLKEAKGLSSGLRHRLGRLGFGEQTARPMTRRLEWAGLGSLLVVGLVSGLLGLRSWSGIGSPTLELAVQGELAWAVAWWDEEGPFDPARAKLVPYSELDLVRVVPIRGPAGSPSNSEVTPPAAAPVPRTYSLDIPSSARVARVYAIADGGLEFRDVPVMEVQHQRLALSATAAEVPVSERLAPDSSGGERRIERSRSASPRPAEYPAGRFRVAAVSVLPGLDEKVWRAELEAVDFVLLEASWPLVAAGPIFTAAGAARMTADAWAFVCPDGQVSPPCVELAFIPEGAERADVATLAPAPSTPIPVPVTPTAQPEKTPTPRPPRTPRPTPVVVVEVTPTPTPQPTPSPTPTLVPVTPTPPQKEPQSITWIKIPATSKPVKMGSNDGDPDEKVHDVTLSGFQISKTEVTVAQYRACVNAGGCNTKDLTVYDTCNWDKPGRDAHPINCVDWTQASAFATWVGGSLPTEAQWEYAARGSAGRKYPWGETPEPSCDLAVMSGCPGETQPVCSKEKGNTPDTGLCDMAGNVWEWVADWYDESYYTSSPVNNPTGPETGSDRVFRGGSWYYDATWLRSAVRYRAGPAYRRSYLGFRVVLAPGVRPPGTP